MCAHCPTSLSMPAPRTSALIQQLVIYWFAHVDIYWVWLLISDEAALLKLMCVQMLSRRYIEDVIAEVQYDTFFFVRTRCKDAKCLVNHSQDLDNR